MKSATLERKQPISKPVAQPKIEFKKELLVVAAVFSVACWVFYSGLGDFPLFNPDECFYAEPAREMLDTGDFITTTLNYDIRYTKPPLHYWFTALNYFLMGSTEFAARFFSATCGAILVACTYWLLKCNLGMRAGLLGAGVLVTAPLFVVTGHLAIGDMSLSLWIAGGLFAFYSAFKEKRKDLLWLGWVLLGCAVMTKGPVGVVLPAAILFAYHLLRRNLLEALSFYKPIVGALIVGAIALPWLIVETMATKGEYFMCFIVMENFQRFTNVVSGHKGAWWYHLAAVGGGFLPWSLLLPQAFQRAFKPSETGIGWASDAPELNRSSSTQTKEPESKLTTVLNLYRNLNARQDLTLFAACFVVVTVAFFSASVSKLLSYTVPCFPALAMLIAIELDSSIRELKYKRLIVPTLILATAYGVGCLATPLIMKLVRHVPEGVSGILSGYLPIQFVAASVAAVLLWKRRPNLALSIFAVTTLLSSGYYGYQAAGMVSQQKEAGLAPLAHFAATSDEPIFIYKARLPSATFYTGRKLELSPAQEKPIEGTNRYTGVAGQSQMPELTVFSGKKPAPQVQPNGLPVYHSLTPDFVQSEIEKTDRAYVISKKNDADYFNTRKGFKKVAEEGVFVLVHWVKPAAENGNEN